MMQLFKYFITLTLVIFLFNTASALEFKVNGNNVVSKETILHYVGKNFNVADKTSLNKTLRKLYSTGFFSDVNISYNKNTVFINVVENLLVRKVNITGMKIDKKFLSNLKTKVIKKFLQ